MLEQKSNPEIIEVIETHSISQEAFINLGDESNHENVCPDDILFKVLKAIANETETEIINQIGEVNANTTEIVTRKWELEDHVSKTGVNLSDYTVDSLNTSGVLYKSFEKTIKKAKNKYYKNIMVTSFMCDICKEFETDSEEAILKHKRIDHSVVCPIKAEKTLDGLCPHCGEVILIFICFLHPIFRFWVFGHF